MFRLLFLLFLMHCSDDLLENDYAESIKNLIVQIDRSNNELYIQVELSGDINSDSIDSVKVNLEYIGGVGIDYKNDFLLYDNGQNGDVIANNGIYTLIDQADKVSNTDEQAEIINVNFPTSFELNDLDGSVIPFSITIKGKKYLAIATLFRNNSISALEKYINIDNTSLAIQINKKDLYIDDANTEVCDRVPNIYGDTFYPISFDWPEATSNGLNNYFTYESGFSVESMNECASTGVSIFKFILNDSDTNESVSSEKSILIYGCGDSICHSNYENISLCPGDCTDD